MDLQPPLVGREDEIRFLEGSLEEVLAGKGRLVLIAGEAGIGKSRLTEEFRKLAAKKGAKVILGRCVPGAPTPYLPFQEALEDYFQANPMSNAGASNTSKKGVSELGLLGWIRGQRANSKSNLELESESERTLHSTLELLKRISKRDPILLILDDLHWADSSSIQLLHFLARNSGGFRALILGTYRPEDLTMEGTDAHPLLGSLRVMRREGLCHEIELKPLGPPELRIAVEQMLDGPIDNDLLLRIGSESGGNPLFVVEVVRLLTQANSILPQGGVWRATGEAQINIPPTVKEVILRRLDPLMNDQRQILDSASVIGEIFDPTILAEVQTMKRLALLEMLDLIARRFHLVRSDEGSYRFSHDKVRQVLYEEISPSRRKELHRIVAQVIENREPDGNSCEKLALHYCNAMETAQCVKYSLQAGHKSLQSYALKEASYYFQNVVTSSVKDVKFAKEHSEALEGLGDVHFDRGEYQAAISTYKEFLGATSDRLHVARVMRKSAECLTYVPEISKAISQLDEAERYGDVETLEAGRIKVIRGRIDYGMGLYTKAEANFIEAEKLFENAEAPVDLGKTLLAHVDVKLAQGLPREALQLAERLRNTVQGLRNPRLDIWILTTLSEIYYTMGLMKKSLEYSSRLLEMAAKSGDYESQAVAYNLRAITYYIHDDFESARQEAQKAEDYSLKTDSQTRQSWAKILLALCEIRLGKLSDAETLAQESKKAEAHASSVIRDGKSHPWLDPWDDLALAELHAAKNEEAASKDKFSDAINAFRKIGRPVSEAIAHTRFGQALLRKGLITEGEEQLTEAVLIWERLGNVSQVQRLKKHGESHC